MAMYAPEHPPLAELEQRYPLDLDTEEAIEVARANVGEIFSGLQIGLGVIQGPCAMTVDRTTIDREGNTLADAHNPEEGFVTIHRNPLWKPRTNPTDWHGLETESDTVEAAYRTVAERAAATANMAIEIGHVAHMDRYARHLTFAWRGARSADDGELLRAMATHQPSLPLGIKNAMDGTIDGALADISRTQELRAGQGAPAILIYRGGQNAKDPTAWEYNYRAALERTEGRLIVDTAHGSEMAFDPEQGYKKSVLGQVACLNRIIEIADHNGEMPAGIMMEASGAPSPTDPVMPFHVALGAARHLHQLRMNMVQVPA